MVSRETQPALILASTIRSKWLASNPNIHRAGSELRSRAYQFQPERYGQQIRGIAGPRNHTNLPCSCILRQALARFWLGRSRINSSGVNAYPASGTLPALSSTSFLRGRTGQQRCRIAEQYGGFRIPLDTPKHINCSAYFSWRRDVCSI